LTVLRERKAPPTGLTIEMCMGMWMTGIPRNPREIRGYGHKRWGNPMGMEVNRAGILQGWKKSTTNH